MIEYSIYDYVNESMGISSPEDAENQLNKIKVGDDRGMMKYIIAILADCVVWSVAGLLFWVLLFKCLTRWLSWPGSIYDKQKRCNELIKAIDARIDQLDDKKDKESIKAVSELKQIREDVAKEKYRLIGKGTVTNNYGSNTYKEQAVSIFDFDIV